MTNYRCGTVCYLLFIILTISGAEVFSSLTSDNLWKQREIRSVTAPSSLPIGLPNIRECTSYIDQLNCKTSLGNKCIRIKYSIDYGSVYQCICSEPDFIPVQEHDFIAKFCQKCDEDIGSEVEDGKCVRKYCNRKQKQNCRTNIVGNACTLVNNDDYKCECNATGYEERGSNCESSQCSFDGDINCKTSQSNKCILSHDRSNYVCICTEPAFVRIPPNSFRLDSCEACKEDNGYGIEDGKCVRKYCNPKQRQNCRTNILGNTCILVNEEDYKCDCNATGYEERGKNCESSECSFDGDINCKTSQGNKCILSYDRYNYACICTEPAFIRIPPSSFRLDSCEECNEDNGYGIEDGKCIRKYCNPKQSRNCRTNILGNRCVLVNDENYKCDCNATGYEERGNACESSQCSFDGDINCKTSQGNKCILSYDRSNYVCICTEPAFVRIPPNSFRLDSCEACNEDNGYGIEDGKCVRKYCNPKQRQNCMPSIIGNTCILVNEEDYKCDCNATGYEERGKTCESSECSFDGDINCKTSQGNKCILSYDRSSYVCICTEPAFIRQPPSTFRLDSCEKCIEDNGFEIEDGKCVRKYCNYQQRLNCGTAASGNTCTFVNGDNYKCECNARGYEEIRNTCTYM